MKRTTILLPEELHARLRREAFRANIGIAELIRSKLRGPKRRAAKRKAPVDPILKVAGIYSGPPISDNIDEELYGI